MNRDRNDGSIAEVTLERYRLNELPPEEAARVERRLQSDVALRARLQLLEMSDAELRAEDRLARLAGDVRARLTVAAAAAGARPEATPFLRRWQVAAAIVVGATALLIAIPRIAVVISDDERIKGMQPALSVYRRVASGSETLADGAVAHAGDVIRLGYRAAGRPYGVILSIDGRGAVTLHLPPNGDRAAALSTDSTVLLDQAYELDDAPRWERFYLITGTTAFRVDTVLDAARAAAARSGAAPPVLAIPADLEQTTFLLQKEERP